MKPPEPPLQKRPIWHYLIAPMLVVSVGLHGALLMLPTGASDDELVPAPDPEEDGIAITRITSSSTPAGSRTSSRNSSAKTNSPSPRNAASSSNNASAENSSARGSRGSASGSRGTRSDPTRSSTPSRHPGGSNPATTTNAAPNERQAAAPDPLVPFLDYFAVFETYRGTVPVEAEEVEALKDLWLSGLKENEVSLADIQPDDIQPLTNLAKISYPAAICLPQAPELAQFLVLVAPDGTVNPDIFPLKDTGYTSFNDQAEAVIRNHDFPNQDVPMAYLVDVAVDYDRETCQWPPAVEAVPDGLWPLLQSYIGPALTTPNQAKAAQERWRSQLDLPPVTPFDGFEATVSYTLDLCLPIAPGSAQFGIVVQPDGTLQSAPQLLRSTGYETFDTQAQQLVEAIAFPAAATPKVHVLNVPVAYNPLLCESLADKDN
jgi:hypothetical protein